MRSTPSPRFVTFSDVENVTKRDVYTVKRHESIYAFNVSRSEYIYDLNGSDVLACMEDVRLAEMWSQGVFINRRHGLAVVVLVLQC